MSKNEFMSQVVEVLSVTYPGLTFESKSVLKNNSIHLNAILVKDEHSNVAPTIYIDDYYEDYLKGKSIENVVAEFMNLYYSFEMPDIDTKAITNWDYVKENIGKKLINTKSNLELLKDVPHIQFLDLSLVFYLEFDEFKSALISNNLFNMWNVTIKELESAATNNRFIIKNMNDIMKGFFPDMDGEVFNIINEPTDHKGLYVISNPKNLYGAVALLDEKVLEKLSNELDDNLIIFPSSVHEIMAISANEMNLEVAKDMVRKVNSTELQPVDILSDNVYYFDRESKTLQIA